MRRSFVMLTSCLALLLLGVGRPPGLADVKDVRHWSYPGYTRVVVELSHAVQLRHQVIRLPADERAGRPERLYLDIPRVWVGRRYEQGVRVGDGLLRGVRLGQNTLVTTRLVIDLERYERHRLLTLRSPHRVVLDIYGHRGGARGEFPRRAVSTRDPSSPVSRLSMPLRPIHTVVIDPGHGGRDPGAIGLGGIREKDVTLQLATQLAGRLSEHGFRAVLTRNEDRYLDLEERTALAEAAGGDLFISIHANASRRRGTRGMEIYTLDGSHERHSLAVAARENGVPPAEVDSLQRALAGLRVAEASHHSERLAELVHAAMVPGISEYHRGFHDLGIKKAPFYVLFLSSMPSILVEAGFLTNRGDVKLLRSKTFQRAMVDRMATGLVRYRNAGMPLVSGAGG